MAKGAGGLAGKGSSIKLSTNRGQNHHGRGFSFQHLATKCPLKAGWWWLSLNQAFCCQGVTLSHCTPVASQSEAYLWLVLDGECCGCNSSWLSSLAESLALHLCTIVLPAWLDVQQGLGQVGDRARDLLNFGAHVFHAHSPHLPLKLDGRPTSSCFT